MEDASLDDFLGTGDESETSSDPSTTEASSDATTESTTDPSADTEDADTISEESSDPDADKLSAIGVEPARATMTFSPEPGECAACGEAVSRRWTDGDELVCRDCKEW